MIFNFDADLTVIRNDTPVTGYSRIFTRNTFFFCMTVFGKYKSKDLFSPNFYMVYIVRAQYMYIDEYHWFIK